jgi:hypothetical protein
LRGDVVVLGHAIENVIAPLERTLALAEGILLHVEHGGAGDAGEVDAAVLVYMTSLRLNGSIRGEAEHDYPMSSNWQSMSTCSAPNRAPSSI